MSDTTRDDIAAAIRAHIADEADGAYLTDWILMAAAAMPTDADATVCVAESSNMPAHHRLGLARHLALHADMCTADDHDD